MRVVIIGSGGHAMVCADILLSMRDVGAELEVCGFTSCRDHGERFFGLPVLGGEDRLDHALHDAVFVAVGDNETRFAVAGRMAQQGWAFASAVHPHAVIGRDVQLAPGCMVGAGAVVNPMAHIGAHAILNTGCSVDHHCHVGAYSHIAPGVRLAGDVTVGRGAFVGIGAVVSQGVHVGEWATVGAGAAVVDDVPDGAVHVGVPARTVD